MNDSDVDILDDCYYGCGNCTDCIDAWLAKLEVEMNALDARSKYIEKTVKKLFEKRDKTFTDGGCR